MELLLTHFAAFALGLALMNLLWMWLSRLQSKLIDEQKSLIDEQSGALHFVHSCFFDAEFRVKPPKEPTQ